MTGGTIVLILGTVLGAAFLAGIYPAAKAAHRPGPRRAEALRGLFPRPP
jgi:ABC-type lipoprotein release transport system permease subunit